jgi:hypothetical protein
MNVSISEAKAKRHDRFTTDVNAVLKRLKKEVPAMKKKKLFDRETFAELYIFHYKDAEGTTWYIV